MPNKNLKKFIASILTLSMLAVEFSFAASAHQVVVVNKAASTVLPSAPTTASSNQISIESLKKDMTEIYNPSEKTKSDLGLREPQTFKCGKPTSGTEPTDKITAVLDSNTQELTISGEGEMKDWSEFNGDLPPWHDAKYKGLVNFVKISEGVTSIGNFAFYDLEALGEVNIPNSVKTIGDSAFKRCTNLNVNFAEFEKGATEKSQLTTIKSGAFKFAGIKEIKIPDSVEFIEDVAFGSCDKLYCVIIGSKESSLDTLGSSVFKGSSHLYTVTFHGKRDVNYKNNKLPFESTNVESINVPEDYGIVDGKESVNLFADIKVSRKKQDDLDKCKHKWDDTIINFFSDKLKDVDMLKKKWNPALTVISVVWPIITGIVSFAFSRCCGGPGKGAGGAEMS